MTPPLVILRPEPGASITARRAEEAGWAAIKRPLFEIAPIDWDPPAPSRFDALLMTSANSARYGGEALAAYRHLPLYAVGTQTAEAARAIGFKTTLSGAGGVEEMADRLRADGKRCVFHPAGDVVRPFDETGLGITRAALYTAKRIPAPNLAGMSNDAICLVHSPRSGLYLHELCSTQSIDRSPMSVIAISPAALDKAGTGWKAAIAARQPTDAAMLEAALSLADLR